MRMQAGNIMLQAWCLTAWSLLGSRLLHPSYALKCTGPGCLRWEHLGFDGLSMQDSSWVDIHVLRPLPVFPFVWTDRVICCDNGRQIRDHARSLKGSPYSCCSNHQRSPSKGAPALNRVCS